MTDRHYDTPLDFTVSECKIEFFIGSDSDLEKEMPLAIHAKIISEYPEFSIPVKNPKALINWLNKALTYINNVEKQKIIDEHEENKKGDYLANLKEQDFYLAEYEKWKSTILRDLGIDIKTFQGNNAKNNEEEQTKNENYD